ncbi:MAG: hypothetical protein ACR2NA_10735 [Solirubrobacterales bacterium]
MRAFARWSSVIVWAIVAVLAGVIAVLVLTSDSQTAIGIGIAVFAVVAAYFAVDALRRGPR